jgi:RNA polymerase sigma-70 factor (ECF subfamily)
MWDKRREIEEETVKSLLFVMAGNMIKNYYKHRQVTFHFAKDTAREELSEAADFNIEQQEFDLKLQQVLSSIPENSRVVFLMNRLESLTYSEIAHRLGLSVKAVEKRMHEALRIIKDQIKHKI